MKGDEALRLARGARALGLVLADAQVARLLGYLDALERWNRIVNLTAIREREKMLAAHLLDSLAVVPHLAAVSRLSDLGSGAGLPGIPIALARPDVRVRLVEAREKKARFLRHVVRDLALTNVEVFAGRAEALPAEHGEEVVVARALGRLAEIVRLAAPILAPHGRVLAMKGHLPQDELRELPAGWRLAAVHRIEVPDLRAERHLLVLEQSRPVADENGA